MALQLRRIVTGHDKDRKGRCIPDNVATNILQSPCRPVVTLTNLWQTTMAPAKIDGREETLDGPF